MKLIIAEIADVDILEPPSPLKSASVSNGYTPPRECVSTGTAGAQTLRYLGHHLLHSLILRLLVLCAPADFEAQRSLL